jgi:hypothetical protein
MQAEMIASAKGISVTKLIESYLEAAVAREMHQSNL